MRSIRVIALVAFAALAAPASALEVDAQGPCPGGVCASFQASDVIPAIRDFVFDIAEPGPVLARFSGKLYCGTDSGTSDAVVDLVSQIVTEPGATADLAGPGGLRHAVSLSSFQSDEVTPGNTFDLASVRRINFATAGRKRIYFKLARLRMDPGTSCIVQNAAFSIVAGARAIVGQAPCPGGLCAPFSEHPTGQVREFHFDVARPGPALVQFHGSMYCAAAPGSAVAETPFRSQIVTGRTRRASSTGPSGLVHYAELKAGAPDAISGSDTFNLFSTRRFDFETAGRQVVRFKMAGETSAASCFVYNGAFTVLLFP